ncbi:MAG: hypothetical protein ACE5NM_13235, partial [Sedimentisphaerales bacterium]
MKKIEMRNPSFVPVSSCHLLPRLAPRVFLAKDRGQGQRPEYKNGDYGWVEASSQPRARPKGAAWGWFDAIFRES